MSDIEFDNRTGYNVFVRTRGGETVIIPDSGVVAYGVGGDELIDEVTVSGVRVEVMSPRDFDRVLNLPPLSDVQPLLVSSAVARWIKLHEPTRVNVYSPDTSQRSAIRENGKIVAVRRLIRWS